MKRYLTPYILQDLKKKMVFIGGPRQVGKTTLCRALVAAFPGLVYLNWDGDEHKRIIRKQQWLDDAPLVIFDELHKYANWKQWIKGVYDLKPDNQQYVVTGSARLDVYKRGGDSLLGRYHYWRLHPFTLDELPANINKNDAYHRLLTLGGFPEPFLQNDEREAKRWRTERFNRILREDVRDLERIQEISLLDLMIDALRERVGGIITYSNIANDLQISPHTVKKWLALTERMYISFFITPYTKKVLRAVQKAPKVYFYDNADCLEDKSARLENLVATHLLKRLQFREDYFGEHCQLHYIRDRDGREVDFVTVIDKKVIDLIEVKLSDDEPSSSLKYYKEKLTPQNTIQIVGDLKRSFDVKGIRVTNPIDYFQQPPWEMD
jgi:predicted AAA+ superfamily ATPase